MDKLRQSLKLARKHIKKVAADLPDEDAYASPYSLLADVAEAIDIFLVEISPALKEASKLAKTSDFKPNRAKKWCRKP